MFYFNIFLGLFSCLLRIVYGLVCGVLFLQRLQKSSLPRSYEKEDPGFITYIGFILLEHQHANPSLQCFARLLLETQGKQLNNDDVAQIKHYEISHNYLSEYPLEEGGEHYQEKQKRFWRKRAEIRWHLFLLLSQNPSLIKYRKRNLPKKKMKLAKVLAGCLNGDNEDTVVDEKTTESIVNLSSKDKKTHQKVAKSFKYEEFQNEDSESYNRTANDSHCLQQNETEKHETEKHETNNYETDNQESDDHETDNHETDNQETERNKLAIDDIDNISYK